MCLAIVLGLSLLVVPAAIVLVAWLLEAKVKGTRTTAPTVPRPQDGEIEFHRAEFVALRSEVAELVKSNAANFQYALLASGGIFAWIAAASLPAPRFPIRESLVSYAWLMPLFISSLFCSLSCATLFQIRRIARYLRIIEDTLGAARPLGWEKHIEDRARTFMLIYIYGWVALLVGDFAVAVLVPLR
jgi:hypothetical protein